MDAVLQPVAEPLLALPAAAENIKSPATQVLEEASIDKNPITTDKGASNSAKGDVQPPNQPLKEKALLALPAAAENIKSPATQVLEEASIDKNPITTDKGASNSAKGDVQPPNQPPEEKAKKTRRGLFQDSNTQGKKPRQNA
ncbi:hypothetical protein Tco_1397126 [Tanacetum coccineum]